MGQLSKTLVGVTVLLAAVCSPTTAAELIPTPLIAPTKVRVVVRACGATSNQQRRTLEVEDAVQINALANEFAALRAHPMGISAAKYSCSTDVTFLQDAKAIASVHVFPCSSLEHGPVEGKRYFIYKAGLNRLPALTHIIGKPGKEKECK